MRFRSKISAMLVIALCLIIPTTAVAQETYTVQSGDTLFRIALNYGVSVESLAETNAIPNTWRIDAGDTLLIPGTESTEATIAEAQEIEATTTHTVQRGELLNSIAQQYGTTVEEIASLNNIVNPDRINAGDTIVVRSVPSTEAVPITEAVANPVADAPETSIPAEALTTHIVQPGEHLAMIAAQYQLSWAALATANGVTDPNQIFAGQQLIIPVAADLTDMGIVDPALAAAVTPPSPTITAGKQIVVDLSDSRIYAFENGQLMRTVLASTGLPATPTVLGDFEIYLRYEAQTMSGPGYYLPDVPWVMYFYQGYGIHGTYWHENWGNPMSHGCVNLPTPEAAWFYAWAEMGTPVRVQA